VSDEAIDLVDKMLQYDHLARPTCQEAMAHPYFDPVRKFCSKNTFSEQDALSLQSFSGGASSSSSKPTDDSKTV